MSTIFISHSRRDEKLIRVMQRALANVSQGTIIEEFIPDGQKKDVPYDEIRQNVAKSDWMFLFLTDNVVATEYTKNWIMYEVGLVSAGRKRLIVFERQGFPLPYPIPYVTDYMLFNDGEVEDVLKIQALAKKMGEPPSGLVGAGVGALLGIPLGPLGMFVGGLLGLGIGSAATQPLLRVRCPRCRTPFNYWSSQTPSFQCPACRIDMNVGMKDGLM